jgi:septal ring factor EnvC (AmiA/AmiB activator)
MPDFFGKLKSGAEKVAFEADKIARLNHAQGEVGKVKRQIEAQYIKLGQLVYQQHTSQEAESPEINEICQSISELEQELAEKQDIVKHIDAETFSEQDNQKPASAVEETPAEEAPSGPSSEPEQAAASETKFCTNCGKEMPVTTKFCPECGQKM